MPIYFKKPDEWVVPLKDKTVKELEDKKVVFQCTFSKADQKAKWCFKGDVRLKNIIFRHHIHVIAGNFQRQAIQN